MKLLKCEHDLRLYQGMLSAQWNSYFASRYMIKTMKFNETLNMKVARSSVFYIYCILTHLLSRRCWIPSWNSKDHRLQQCPGIKSVAIATLQMDQTGFRK